MGTKANTTAKPFLATAIEKVPSTDLNGIEHALKNITGVQEQLAAMKPLAEKVVVNSKETQIQAGELLKQIRDLKKLGPTYLAPFKTIVKRAADFIRNKETSHESAALEIENILTPKIERYIRDERIAAEEETRRVREADEKARRGKIEADRQEAIRLAAERKETRIAEIKAMLKAGEISKTKYKELMKEVGIIEEDEKDEADAMKRAAIQAPVEERSVLPNTAPVAGLRRRLEWSFTVTDVNKIPREYMIPDLSTIGRNVRNTPGTMKDKTPDEIKAALERDCPGIVVRYTDAV